MADIRPFCAYRPEKDLADKIAALPYDVYNEAEARKAVEGDKYSFLRIDRAETQFPEGIDPYSPEVYAKAAELLDEQIKKGEFVKDETPCYYIYELTMDGRSQSGIVACASVDDYLNNIIKKHENTRKEKEIDRINHVDTLSAHSGPIFLAYRGREDLSALINKKKQETPEVAFVSDDGIGHRVWVISDNESVKKITECFADIPELYIADGHHRCASAVKVGLKRREQNKDYTGDEEFNYFLSVIFAAEELKIMDYNRVLKDLNGYTKEELLKKIEEKFTVEKIGETAYSPRKKGEMGMFLGNTWYKLTVKPEFTVDDPVEGLDVAFLQREILEPVFGIKDPTTDKRIDFVGGIRGLKELERRCSVDCEAAFAMYPTDIQELFNVADAGKLMPPKSTWFEPKLRSGLFIHRF